MPLIEDAPKKKFKPKRRNSWDLASILNETAQEKSDESPAANASVDQSRQEQKQAVVATSPSTEITKPTDSRKASPSQPEQQAESSRPANTAGANSAKAPIERKPSTSALANVSPPPTSEVTAPTIQMGSAPNYLGAETDSEPNYSGAAPIVEPNYLGSDMGSEMGSATGSEMGSTVRGRAQKTLPNLDMKIPIGEHAVLRALADLEVRPGELIYVNRAKLAMMSAQTNDGVKSALRRLREKNLIALGEFKRGATKGWTSYRIMEPGREVLGSTAGGPRVHVNWVQNRVPQRVQNRVPQRVLSSSSSSLDLLDTTTTDQAQNFERNSANDPSVGIDCSPLGEIGFKTSHARQALREGMVTAEQLQESIHHFAFDLKHNNKEKLLKGPPLNFFMGIVRKGPYAPPPNFESAEEVQLRKYLEGKEQQLKRRRETEDRIRGIQCEEWLDSLSVEDKNKLVPPNEFSRAGSPAHSARLQEYFAEQVWPKLRKTLLQPNS